MKWYPRVLWVGIGCQGGTSREVIESAITQVCRNYDLAEGAIAGIATIDTKGNEVGLIELCQGRNWPLKTFSAEILNLIQVPNPSTIVSESIGVSSVAEAAAICATINLELSTAEEYRYKQICNHHLHLSAFLCGSKNPLIVPKQIFRSDCKQGSRGGAVTVAIASAETE
ncbi:cobalamin biosynthesis protein [Kamptonema sp. UHCC 0994]|uniref:cobalamin biosynthesis protein n=1 Tax=Kamptonema sp. UHCC 0994 TaxID=3031329 RepID=UPI0023B93A86|nr:cobalamin biosynthesis protein [Kamptonema sp. UHCC 0994]MDF0554427.1 cobalamin biosynthesis protein [Kamptonema sp. UHCC 0994]